MKYGYISKKSRIDLEEQHSHLNDCDHFVCEAKTQYHTFSSVELNEFIPTLNPGDMIKVVSIDAFPDSISRTIDLIADLFEKGIGFFSLKEKEITGLVCYKIAVIKREKNKKRFQENVTKYRSRGRKGGRKKGLTDKSKIKAKKAFELYNQGTPIKDIMTGLEIGCKNTLYAYLRHEGMEV